MKVLRMIVAVLTGYLLMVILITLVQEVWFGGVGWYKSTTLQLFTAGALTFASAVLAGVLATRVSPRYSIIPVVIMAGLVAIETTMLLVTGRIGGPLWFDLSGSASLMVGVIAGWSLLRMYSDPPGELQS